VVVSFMMSFRTALGFVSAIFIWKRRNIHFNFGRGRILGSGIFLKYKKTFYFLTFFLFSFLRRKNSSLSLSHRYTISVCLYTVFLFFKWTKIYYPWMPSFWPCLNPKCSWLPQRGMILKTNV
jgi:hypothetical protein